MNRTDSSKRNILVWLAALVGLACLVGALLPATGRAAPFVSRWDPRSSPISPLPTPGPDVTLVPRIAPTPDLSPGLPPTATPSGLTKDPVSGPSWGSVTIEKAGYSPSAASISAASASAPRRSASRRACAIVAAHSLRYGSSEARPSSASSAGR